MKWKKYDKFSRNLTSIGIMPGGCVCCKEVYAQIEFIICGDCKWVEFKLWAAERRPINGIGIGSTLASLLQVNLLSRSHSKRSFTSPHPINSGQMKAPIISYHVAVADTYVICPLVFPKMKTRMTLWPCAWLCVWLMYTYVAMRDFD